MEALQTILKNKDRFSDGNEKPVSPAEELWAAFHQDMVGHRVATGMVGNKVECLGKNIGKLLRVLNAGNKTKIFKKQFQNSVFYLSDVTPFMKKQNPPVTGDHFDKNYDHRLMEADWQAVCRKLKNPFAVAKDKDRFRFFLDIKVNRNYVIVCFDAVNVGSHVDVNAIKTALVADSNGEAVSDVIYTSKKISPDQQAVLNGDLPVNESLPERLILKYQLRMRISQVVR